MECVICKNGTTRKGKVTITLERKGTVVIIKEVSAKVCNNCGEYYLDADITKQVLKLAEDAYKKGTEVEILKMRKVA